MMLLSVCSHMGGRGRGPSPLRADDLVGVCGWLVCLVVLMVLAASGVWACPRQSWRGSLIVVVVQVLVLSMSVTCAVAGVSPGYAEGEVGVGYDAVGGVIGDAAGEGGAGDDFINKASPPW